MKKCDMCGLEANSLEELDGVFVKAKTCKYGYRNRCRKCENKRMDGKHYRSRAGRRESEIRLRYGIELSEYESKMATSSICQICGTSYKLCYDHNHDTNEFRGVLCRKCNTALGMFNDDKDIVEKALEYLTHSVSVTS